MIIRLRQRLSCCASFVDINLQDEVGIKVSGCCARTGAVGAMRMKIQRPIGAKSWDVLKFRSCSAAARSIDLALLGGAQESCSAAKPRDAALICVLPLLARAGAGHTQDAECTPLANG